MKKYFNLFAAVLFIFVVTGCGKSEKDLVHDTYEGITNRFCEAFTTGLTYEEFIDMYPKEYEATIRKETTEESYDKNMKNQTGHKTCTVKETKTITDSKQLQELSKYIKDELEADITLDECKSFDYTIDETSTDDAGVCKIKNKWYLIMMG